jgi:hypothetical protein
MLEVILFENADWLVVNKPTGIATHGGRAGDIALQEWIDLHWDRATFVVQRLDKGTSGVLIFAKTTEASGRAQAIHESEDAVKEYVFRSHAESRKAEWTVKTPLDGAPAETTFWKDKGLYRAVIRRGKTHQIRRHAQESGVPVLGDDEYGGRPAPRLFLHCRMLQWPEIGGELVAPLPPGFERPELACQDRRLDYLSSVTDAFRAADRDEGGPIDILGKHARGRGLPEIAAAYGATFTAAMPEFVTEHGTRHPAAGFEIELRDVRRRVFKEGKGKRVAAVTVSIPGAKQVESVAELGRKRWDLIVCRGSAPEIREALAPGGAAMIIGGHERTLQKVFPVTERISAPLDFPSMRSVAVFVRSK